MAASEPKEQQIQSVILDVLKRHPKVAWAHRMNVGATKIGGRFIRFGLPGMCDITGQLKDGRRLEVEVKRPEHKGKHDLYDVLFFTATGELICRKVGITARGHARYADVCKTFGMSVKPYKTAVTYPTKEAARAAEDALIAEVCTDKKWRRIGKEAFELIPAA